MIFNIPKQITQGDTVKWYTLTEQFSPYKPYSDTLSCFIRGAVPLDLVGVPNLKGWNFRITSVQSNTLTPGKYKTQFVLIELSGDKTTLGTTEITVLPSFENLTEIETRSADEIELELITNAIAKLKSGAVAEYRIGDRMMRYTDLGELTKRQQYLRTRVAIANGRLKPGGRNIGVRFMG